MFKLWEQSSAQQLYNSAVAAFPDTTKRQHLIRTINISEIRYTPFIGLRTLLVRSVAFNEENGHHYNPLILFKQANFNPNQNIVPFIASDNGQPYQVERLSLNDTNCLVRCECDDHKWRFCHFNHLDRSLWGKNRKPYVGQGLWEANPQRLPGLCKHLMSLSMALENAGLIN